MKVTIDMPHVLTCEVTECAYNDGQACHARAITVGDGVHPGCDTFFVDDVHVRDVTVVAGVGACKVSACRHNRDYQCRTEAIRVGVHEQHGDCMTFDPR